MKDIFGLSSTDLGSLLCSRICHDLVSPLGAIGNAIELLNENIAPEESFELLHKATHSALARLQFVRLAFGGSFSSDSLIDIAEARSVTYTLMHNEKIELGWNEMNRMLPGKQIRLLLNLVLIARSALTQSGKVSVLFNGSHTKPEFSILGEAPSIKFPDGFLDLYSGTDPVKAIDARNIQFYYTLLIAHEAGMRILAQSAASQISLEATLL